MKNTLLILGASLFIWSCSTPKDTDNQTDTDTETVEGRYGDTTWTTEGALTAENFLAKLEGKDSLETMISGKIAAACQAKGCWMSMDVNGNDMLVRFKDYGFFVPMNSAGYDATIRGWAYVDTLSVEDQIELVKDSKETEEKKAEEIASITDEKLKLTFMADGVVID